jgi:hypothetical protein
MSDRRHTEAVVQGVLRRHGRSLMQYLREAFPYLPGNGDNRLARFQQLATEDLESQVSLTNFLLRKHLSPPYLGPYPDRFTTFNYVSFDFLLPQLLQAERAEIAHLVKDVHTVDDAEVRERLQKVLDMKRRHLAELEELAHPKPQSSVA